MKTNIPLLILGLFLTAFTAFSQVRETSAVIGVTPGAIERVQERAASGDANAQKTLAEWLWAGSVLKKEPVQAYKWALVASSQGNKDAKHIVSELDLFLSGKDKEKGRALADQYIAEQKKLAKKPKQGADETKR
jgi:TPR repeat protein